MFSWVHWWGVHCFPSHFFYFHHLLWPPFLQVPNHHSPVPPSVISPLVLILLSFLFVLLLPLSSSHVFTTPIFLFPLFSPWFSPHLFSRFSFSPGSPCSHLHLASPSPTYRFCWLTSTGKGHEGNEWLKKWVLWIHLSHVSFSSWPCSWLLNFKTTPLLLYYLGIFLSTCSPITLKHSITLAFLLCNISLEHCPFSKWWFPSRVSISGGI